MFPVGMTRAPAFGGVQGDRILAREDRYTNSKATPDLLRSYCAIVEAADTMAAVVRFTKRWGLVELCQHALPAYHRSNCTTATDEVDAYKVFALCLNALQRIGAQLANRRIAEQTDWELAASVLKRRECPQLSWAPSSLQKHSVTFDDLESAASFMKFLASSGVHAEFVTQYALAVPSDQVSRAYELLGDMEDAIQLEPEHLLWTRDGDLIQARIYFEVLMGRLLTTCRVQPRFCWRGAWMIEFDSPSMGSPWTREDFDLPVQSNLAGILAIQLMVQITAARRMKQCRTCPRWFTPNRGQVYCPSCGIRAAWRTATQRYRSKPHGSL